MEPSEVGQYKWLLHDTWVIAGGDYGWRLNSGTLPFMCLVVDGGCQLVPYRALNSLNFSMWPCFLITWCLRDSKISLSLGSESQCLGNSLENVSFFFFFNLANHKKYFISFFFNFLFIVYFYYFITTYHKIQPFKVYSSGLWYVQNCATIITV